MFGFLNPATRSKEYRALYCNTCRHVRSNYGVTATPFVSYEAVLIHALACDAEQISLEASTSHCKIAPFPKKANDASEVHKTVGEFSSALTHLLLKIKIEDDIHDDKSWRAKGLRKFYSKNFTKSFEYFSALDAAFVNKIEAFLASHSHLEGRNESISLEEYAQPTASAFEYVFGLLGTALNDVANKDVYSRIGELVGRAIIYADCGFDWKRDKKKGAYNPVQDTELAVAAFAKSQEVLREAAAVVVNKFGSDSVTAKTLLGVHDRLYRFAERDKMYKKFLSPINAIKDKAEEKVNKSVVLASTACPSLMLFAAEASNEESNPCCVVLCCAICCCAACMNSCICCK